MEIPFIGPTYQSVSPKWDPERSINVYVEASGPASQSKPTALVSRPGLRLWQTMGAGPIRGLHVPRAAGASGNLIVVSGNTVYRVDSAKVATSVGTVGGGTTPVSITDNGTDAIIVDGSANGWTLNLATNTLAAIAQAGFYGGVRVDFLDGYFILPKPGTQTFYISDLYSTTFNALNFASAESIPDALQTLAVANRELWLFGAGSTEVFVSSASGFVFQRLPGATTLVGCGAPRSVAVHETNLFWVGASVNSPLGVYRNQGYSAARISPPAIEQLINKRANLSDIVGYTYSEDSHIFYVLNFLSTSDTALVFDLTSGLWHERGFSVELPVIGKPTTVTVDQLAIFVGGFTTVDSRTVEKYTYSTGTVVVGADYSLGVRRTAAVGDSRSAIVSGGYFATTVRTVVSFRYTYQRDLWVGGSNIGPARSNGAGASGPDFGVFAGGFDGTDIATTHTYGYNSDVVAAGVSLGSARRSLAGLASATTGIFSGGYNGAANVAVTDKYTFATKTVAAGTLLGTARYALAGASNSEVGLFAGGFTTVPVTTTDRYIHADNTVLSGAALGTDRWGHAGAGNATVGLFAGGLSAIESLFSTEKYTYSTNSMAGGTRLNAARIDLTGASS